jgi:hypothetical protein
MAGLTAWSATRTPEQVFELLERVYSAFDEIADRLKVFKVETIGDCYVAVVRPFLSVVPPPPPQKRIIFMIFLFCFSQTGVPEPQDDHAIIMAKCACEILSKMINLTQDLAGTMGQDTAELQNASGPTFWKCDRYQCKGLPNRLASHVFFLYHATRKQDTFSYDTPTDPLSFLLFAFCAVRHKLRQPVSFVVKSLASNSLEIP